MRLITISDRRPKNEPAAHGAIEMLTGCHTRIRTFMQTSRNLAQAESVPPSEVASAASSIVRYFTQALPLHEDDENISLFPRLHTKGDLVREAVETMVEQHQAIDELVADLLAMCKQLARRPQSLASVRGRMQHTTAALERIFEAHLHLEESVIFPALQQLLTVAQLDEMESEMRARRQSPVSAIDAAR